MESVINLRVISNRIKLFDYSFKFDGLQIALQYVCSKLVNEQLLKTLVNRSAEKLLDMRNRILENLHLPFWLIKDACWAMALKPLGLLMIFPTVSLAIYLVIRTRNEIKELLPNLSIVCWITANSIWMCDEFYQLGIKDFSLMFFSFGIICIAIWLFKYFPEEWRKSKSEELS